MNGLYPAQPLYVLTGRTSARDPELKDGDILHCMTAYQEGCKKTTSMIAAY